MRQFMIALFGLGLTGLAWAADPAPADPTPVPPACGPKVCVPVPTTTKKDKVIYDEKCVDYCLPRCSIWSIFSGRGCGCDCGDGGCANCGSPRVRHVLIKKIVHEECPDVKCEVREAPCAPPCVTGP